MNPKTSDQTLEGGARDGGADGSLGEQLRRAREARGISLREISEQTRITIRHLEAIESDDHKNLPGGIFNRSFVKAYARQIGFGEQRALDLYNRAARERGDSNEDSAPVVHRPRVYTDGGDARSPAVTLVLSAVIVGILILVVYAALHYYRRTGEQAVGAEPPQATPEAAAPQQPGAGQPPAPQQPGAAAAPSDALNVTVKANDTVWMRVLADDETVRDKPGANWGPGETQAFTPRQKLTLNYAKTLAGALEVTVNGSRLRAPTDTRPGVSQEWVITRDNYKQYAQ